MDDRPRQVQACTAEPSVARSSDRGDAPSEGARASGDAAAPAPPDAATTLRAALAHLSEALIIVDREGAIVVLNEAATHLLGAEALQIPLSDWPRTLGIYLSDMRTFCPPEELAIVQALRGRAVADQELFVRNRDVPRGIWLAASAQPLVDEAGRPCGAASVLRDTTRRKRVEQALSEERRLLQLHSRRQAALADIELAVNTPDELRLVLDQVVRLTVRHLPCDDACVMAWRPEDDSIVCEASTLVGAAAPGVARRADADGGATRWIVEHGQALSVSSLRDDPFRLGDLFGETPPGAYAGTPLADEQRVVGALYALDRAGRRFTQEDLDFLAALASRASTALTKVRLYEQLRDLNAALRRRSAQLQEQEQRFRTLADTAPVLIWMSGSDGAPTYFNRTWLEFTGGDSEIAIAKGWSHGIHPDDVERCRRALAGAVADCEPFTLEYRRRRADGVYRWLIDTGIPRRTPDGEFVGFIGSCTDITVRKEAEASLRRQREHLETVISARTEELKASHERLRVADRLATIGTLTAGLGHDMNNLLFPLRCRLETLDPDAAPPDVADTLRAVARTVEYLQQLSDGLRLFARDPDDAGSAHVVTALSDWWEQVRPLLAKANNDRIRLEWNLDDDLPPVRIAPHRLTQAILNLVINAAEAMPEGGVVRVWARASRGGQAVRIGVHDEGQGMSPEVRLRAFDPFFTTKTRTLSTGLGLSLVHGVVTSVGGSIDVDSQMGEGTTVVLDLPAALDLAPAGGEAGAPARRKAMLAVTDPRREAWVARCLEAAGFDVIRASAASDATLCVMDATSANLPAADRFLREAPDRRVIGIGAAAPGWAARGVSVVEDPNNLQAVRAAIDSVTWAGSGGGA